MLTATEFKEIARDACLELHGQGVRIRAGSFGIDARRITPAVDGVCPIGAVLVQKFKGRRLSDVVREHVGLDPYAVVFGHELPPTIANLALTSFWMGFDAGRRFIRNGKDPEVPLVGDRTYFAVAFELAKELHAAGILE